MKLEKYSRDFEIWRDWASINYSAAKVLFDTGDPLLMFPAATLGHHALEMYLKSALIVKGLAICRLDPKGREKPDSEKSLAKQDCAWGHDLVKLAKQLEQRNPSFDLNRRLPRLGFPTIREPLAIRQGLDIFNPFFKELRYPQQRGRVDEVGAEHRRLLEALVTELRHARFEWNKPRDSP